jgi:hypothetical protein
LEEGKLGIIELLKTYQGGNVSFEIKGKDLNFKTVIKKMRILEIRRKYIKLQNQEDSSESDIFLNDEVTFKLLKDFKKETVIEIYLNDKEKTIYKVILNR